MRVAVVYNEPSQTSATEHWLSQSHSEGTVVADTFQDPSEYEVVEHAHRIAAILSDAGYETALHGVDRPAALWQFLETTRPDLIFNCCESIRGNASMEMNVAAMFEILEVPFTGSPALTLGISLDKSIAKALFAAHEVPTAPWAVLHPSDAVASTGLQFPLIVKPLREDASIGIGTDSVVSTSQALAARVQFVWEKFRQPALVEEFIEGRELNISLLADASQRLIPLPASEILFDGYPSGKPRIVTYEAKWMEDSPYYASTTPQCPAELTPELLARVREVACKAATAVGLRDYGRIDFRVRASDDAIFVLEANPNPAITADSGFARAMQASGATHADLIRTIAQRAVERTRLKREQR